jgi:hypothetical protein
LPLDGAARRSASVPLCAALLLLSACGGGGEQAISESAATEAGAQIAVDNGTEGRRFVLWQPGQEGDVRTAQVRLVLTPLDEAMSQPLALYEKFLAEPTSAPTQKP